MCPFCARLHISLSLSPPLSLCHMHIYADDNVCPLLKANTTPPPQQHTHNKEMAWRKKRFRTHTHTYSHTQNTSSHSTHKTNTHTKHTHSPLTFHTHREYQENQTRKSIYALIPKIHIPYSSPRCIFKRHTIRTPFLHSASYTTFCAHCTSLCVYMCIVTHSANILSMHKIMHLHRRRSYTHTTTHTENNTTNLAKRNTASNCIMHLACRRRARHTF